MPYTIELLSLGSDSSALLTKAADWLNKAQKPPRPMFTFQTIDVVSPLGSEALGFKLAKYNSADIFDWIEEKRRKHGGRHPCIIAFVAAPLESPTASNLFGSHRAKLGLAVVTLHDSGHYVREEERFCAYFLARYALSFVNPAIKNHDDEGRKSCYFSRKTYKPEIRQSMDSGNICDDCMRQLQQPSDPNVPAPDVAELEALESMRNRVSGDFPYAIVMKGGGVKGLAFAGALLELESYFWFDRHVGASAGAIVALLLAAGYTPKELGDILRGKRFADFKDARLWQIPFYLSFRLGMHPGEHFRTWMADLLVKKMGKLKEPTMSDLQGALIYATRRGPGTLEFDSLGTRSDSVASFAARCSMSIPFFFTPERVDGRRVFDGGLRNNFPLKTFIAKYPNKPFIGLYLGKPDNRNRVSVFSDLLDIVIEGDEREIVDQNISSIVVIDTSPVGVVDFNLTDEEKTFLVQEGRACALEYLQKRKLDDGPHPGTIAEARSKANFLRTSVIRNRRKRLLRRRVIGAVTVLACLSALWIWSQ